MFSPIELKSNIEVGIGRLCGCRVILTGIELVLSSLLSSTHRQNKGRLVEWMETLLFLTVAYGFICINGRARIEVEVSKA